MRTACAMPVVPKRFFVHVHSLRDATTSLEVGPIVDDGKPYATEERQERFHSHMHSAPLSPTKAA